MSILSKHNSQLAKQYSVSVRTIYRWLRSGKISLKGNQLLQDCDDYYLDNIKCREDLIRSIIDDCQWLLKNVENYNFEESISPKLSHLVATHKISESEYSNILKVLKNG